MGVNQIAGASITNAYQATQVQPAADLKNMNQATDAAVVSEVAAGKKPATVVLEDKQPTGDGSSVQNQNEMSQEKIKKAIETINKQLSHTECQYGFHEKTNRVTIKIVDKETDKVIKEFPPEETLEMIAKAWELAGILVDEKL